MEIHLYAGGSRHDKEHGISTERAFLLLKPDCLRRELTGAALAALAGAGLRVECRHRIELTPRDVRHLWTEYTDRNHVLARAFLDRYLTSGESEVLLVSGADAFEAVRRVKRSLRSRYALGVFANVVHAAERRGELARQGNHLLGRCAACAEPFVSDEPPLNPRRPGGIDFHEHFDVARLVDQLWPVLRDDLPEPAPYRLGRRTPVAAVVLGGDRAHTLDSSVSAVWRALPGVEPAHAVLLALHADRTGGFPIAVGARRAVARSHRLLIEQGIRNCWQIDADHSRAAPAHDPWPSFRDGALPPR